MKKIMRGQSMIEAVVAVGIVILLVTGLLVATTSTLKFGRMSKDRTTALQYAKEGLEIVRVIKDNGWDNIPSDSTATRCLLEGEQEFTTGSCQISTTSPFSRTIDFTDDGDCTVANDCRKVTVTVSWMDSVTRTVTLSTYLTNWRSTL